MSLHSKAYVLIKTRIGTEQAFFDRLATLGLTFHDAYSILGSGYDILIELLYSDWQELDEFIYTMQRDPELKRLVLDEMRMISHDKTIKPGPVG